MFLFLFLIERFELGLGCHNALYALRITQKLMMIPFFDSMGIIYIHWVPTGITVNKEYYIEVLREFSKRFRRKRPELFESGQ